MKKSEQSEAQDITGQASTTFIKLFLLCAWMAKRSKKNVVQNLLQLQNYKYEYWSSSLGSGWRHWGRTLDGAYGDRTQKPTDDNNMNIKIYVVQDNETHEQSRTSTSTGRLMRFLWRYYHHYYVGLYVEISTIRLDPSGRGRKGRVSPDKSSRSESGPLRVSGTRHLQRLLR